MARQMTEACAAIVINTARSRVVSTTGMTGDKTATSPQRPQSFLLADLSGAQPQTKPESRSVSDAASDVAAHRSDDVV